MNLVRGGIPGTATKSEIRFPESERSPKPEARNADGWLSPDACSLKRSGVQGHSLQAPLTCIATIEGQPQPLWSARTCPRFHQATLSPSNAGRRSTFPGRWTRPCFGDKSPKRQSGDKSPALQVSCGLRRGVLADSATHGLAAGHRSIATPKVFVPGRAGGSGPVLNSSDSATASI